MTMPSSDDDVWCRCTCASGSHAAQYRRPPPPPPTHITILDYNPGFLHQTPRRRHGVATLKNVPTNDKTPKITSPNGDTPRIVSETVSTNPSLFKTGNVDVKGGSTNEKAVVSVELSSRDNDIVTSADPEGNSDRKSATPRPELVTCGNGNQPNGHATTSGHVISAPVPFPRRSFRRRSYAGMSTTTHDNIFNSPRNTPNDTPVPPTRSRVLVQVSTNNTSPLKSGASPLIGLEGSSAAPGGCHDFDDDLIVKPPRRNSLRTRKVKGMESNREAPANENVTNDVTHNVTPIATPAVTSNVLSVTQPTTAKVTTSGSDFRLRRSAHSTSSIASSLNSSQRSHKNCMDFTSMKKSLGSVTRTGALSERGVITTNFTPTRRSSIDRLTRKLDQGRVVTKKDFSYSKVDPDITYKVLILGDSSVGKTSLLNALSFIQSGEEQGFSSWTSGFANQSLLPTIGIDFRKVTFLIDGARVQLQIWDTAGQERFRSINKFHYRDAMGILLAYDITQRETFNNIQSWLDGIDMTEASQTAEDIIIVGNKSDLEMKRQVTKEDKKRLTDKTFYPVYEVSAKTESNSVERVFMQLALKIVERCHPKLMTAYLTPEELSQEEEMIAFEERTTSWASPQDLITPLKTRMQRFYPVEAGVKGRRQVKDGNPGKKSFQLKSLKKSPSPPPAPPVPQAPLPHKSRPFVRQDYDWSSPSTVYSPNRDKRGTIKLGSKKDKREKSRCCDIT